MTTTELAKSTTSSLTKNRIALQRGFLVKPFGVVEHLSDDKKLAIHAELMKLGYILTNDALEYVTIEWFNDVTNFLKASLGVGDYQPFYIDFLKQMELSEAELYWNAITHYLSEGNWEPDYGVVERTLKIENMKLSTIRLGSEEDFRNIFTSLVSINQSLTENDKGVITWFVREHLNDISLPDTIPFKETLCMLASFGVNVPVKTTTDVLRIAVHFSGGDISLPAVPTKESETLPQGRRAAIYSASRDQRVQYRDTFKFKKFSRSERRYLLGLLENTNLDLGEMKHKLERWLRLGEILHPGEFQKRFPKSFTAFNSLRNEAKAIKTFESKVETTFIKGDVVEGLNILSQRPGVFARKLDWLLRNYDTKLVFDAFKKVSMRVSRKVLWELYNHFMKRDTASPRSIMIKGKRSIKKQLDPLPPMSKLTINSIQSEILNCLGQHFSKLEPLGKVWIDGKLKQIPLPSAMRSVNTSVKTYVRGTRVSFNANAKVVRPYVHWFDEFGNEDIDLSVGFYDSSLVEKTHISFTNLRNEELNSCHSGDIVRRQGACAEYVDIDIEACLRNGVRYAMVQVHNYQGRPMHTMQDCVFGLMEREFPESNLNFVPNTITNAVKMANESTTVCITMLDLEKREYIWCDLEIKHRGLVTLESARNETGQIIREMLFGVKLSVYDLLELHAQNRGTLTRKKTESDTQFNYEDFVTSYEKSAGYM